MSLAVNLALHLHTANGVLGILATLGFAVYLTFSRFGKSTTWRVVVTPLASIIGSGFLVAAPLMYTDFGVWSIPFVLLLNLFAIGVGWGIRVNMRDFDPFQGAYAEARPWLTLVERSSNWILGGCYVVAIAFYVSLLSSFAFRIFNITGESVLIDGVETQVLTKGLSAIILCFIGVYGSLKGLHRLEDLEKFVVNVNMGVLGGLLATLVVYFVASVVGHTETRYVYDLVTVNGRKLQMLGGLLLITQGFETVKYLGDVYSVELREKAIIVAQIVAAVVYLAVVPLVGPIARSIDRITETAIIGVVSQSALGMGLILSLAAIFSQFGAAMADTIGASKLLEGELKRLLSRRQAYLPVAGVSIMLVWFFPVLDIIAIASRFFALYYCAQTVIATVVSIEQKKLFRACIFAFIAVLALLIVVFAIPSH